MLCIPPISSSFVNTSKIHVSWFQLRHFPLVLPQTVSVATSPFLLGLVLGWLSLWHPVYMYVCLWKCKVVPVPRHEHVLGSGGTAPCILNLGTRWKWMVSFTPQPLYPRRKNPWNPLDKWLGELQSRCWRSGEDETSQALPGIETRSSKP
jgi:hypothetical protein